MITFYKEMTASVDEEELWMLFALTLIVTYSPTLSLQLERHGLGILAIRYIKNGLLGSKDWGQ